MDEYSFKKQCSFANLAPCVLDAVLATSFDWRELANRLAAFGRKVPQAKSGMLELPHTVYRMAHCACLADVDFALSLEHALTRMHARSVLLLSQMQPAEICNYLEDVDIRDRLAAGGFLWALIADDRECIRRIADVFVRRILTEFYRKAYDGEGKEFQSIMKDFTEIKNDGS